MIKMAFGAFEGKWGWRIEWMEDGVLHHRDFYQVDYKPGKDRADADAFRQSLLDRQIAA